jgi:hypothetical protein
MDLCPTTIRSRLFPPKLLGELTTNSLVLWTVE